VNNIVYFPALKTSLASQRGTINAFLAPLDKGQGSSASGNLG
jgi:hypothetical protein